MCFSMNTSTGADTLHMSAAIGVLYRLKNYLSKDILKIVFYSLAYTYLQYAIRCWENAHVKKYLCKLRVKQNQIVRIISKIKNKINATITIVYKIRNSRN